MFTVNCKGKLLSLETPVVMGIINATPDSFYRGELTGDIQHVIVLAKKMVDEGAAILDIGGQSTRPGSKRISVDEELSRVIPVITAIHEYLPGILLSIDTYSSHVAEAAVEAGASIVNDISAGSIDDGLIQKVAALKVPYICMHMQGTPETMQQEPHYDNVVKDLISFFIQKIETCKVAGINDVIIDPGFGFGKTIHHNFQLLKELASFAILQKPLLAGLSRKGTIYKTLGITAAEALNGTTVLNTIALLNGASILRVHDVKEAREAITLYNAYKKTPL